MGENVSNLSEEYDLLVDWNRGLGHLFHDQVQQKPHSVAVTDGQFFLTYTQLHNRASYLAWRLSQLSISIEEPVAVVLQHGFRDIIAQLAILYAGGTCVPLDASLPDHKILELLDPLKARCVVTDNNNKHRQLPFHLVVLTEDDITGQPESYAMASTDLSHRTHLIHTSGTTSRPKAVQIIARSILQVAFHAPFAPLDAADVVAHNNNTSFDVSLFGIWAPLLRGGRVAVLHKVVMLDPYAMAEEIDRLGITVMAITMSLLSLVASTYPEAVKKLRICIVGGEAANVRTVSKVLSNGPPGMLVNAYGPTECCVFCLARHITPQDVQAGVLGIGKPIGRNLVYIADDAGQESDKGELWVGGPCVSRGYLHQPDKNSASFVTIGGVRFYRTGDMVKRSSDGQILFVGRRDHQVKIRGFRIELEAVESALFETGEYSEAVAMKMEVPQLGAGSVLVAYAVRAFVSSPAEPTVAMDATMRKLRDLLPEYMVPYVQLISKMPLDSHGKADRKKLSELYQARWQLTHTPSTSCTKTTQSELARLWTDILGSPVSLDDKAAADNHEFFSMGGTSLQAALLIGQIWNTFGVRVSLMTLYNNSTLSALSSIIQNYPEVDQLEAVREEREAWRTDARIADSLRCPAGAPVDWRADGEGRVFLTGATGFVGAFMLADLLRMSPVRRVACLVRALDPVAGLGRVRAAMAKYGMWEDHFEGKLLILPGRLQDEFLGLGEARFNDIARWASVVFHLGAHVNYTQPYSIHRPANTLGTFNVVRFACAGRTKALHYMSSISCFGPTGFITGAAVVEEDEPLLGHVEALLYDHGYSQSQWVVEELLRGLMLRQFPIAVYRPGFITGHSRSGACNPDDFFSRLIHGCLEMGYYPELPRQRKEFVPVDYVSAAVLHIAASPRSLGHAFHIVPPARELSMDMNSSMQMVGECAHSPIQGIAYADWIDRLAVNTPRGLQPLQPMLEEKMRDGFTRWELYQDMPLYQSENTARALADYPGGLEFPALGPLLMTKYMDYLQRGQYDMSSNSKESR